MATPDFQSIKRFWELRNPLILSCKANEFAIDPYEWELCDEIVLTPIEQWLWHDIRSIDAVFYPQYPVGRFFVDFANPVAKVAIECDGFEFHKDKKKDGLRDAQIQELGWSIYRITGKDCRTDFDEERRKEGASHRFILAVSKDHGLIRE